MPKTKERRGGVREGAGRPPQTSGNPVVCSGCGYDWLTISKAKYIACPRCHKQHRNEYHVRKMVRPMDPEQERKWAR